MLKKQFFGLAVHWLGLHAFTARGLSLTPGQGTKILQATQCGQKKEKKKEKEKAVLGVATRESKKCALEKSLEIP